MKQSLEKHINELRELLQQADTELCDNADALIEELVDVIDDQGTRLEEQNEQISDYRRALGR